MVIELNRFLRHPMRIHVDNKLIHIPLYLIKCIIGA